MSDRRRWVPALFLVFYLVFLAVVTLSPEPRLAIGVVVRVSTALRHVGAPAGLALGARVELVLNVLMVAPAVVLGGLVWRRWTWRDWTAAGFVVSLAVELVQGVALPDRSAQTTDVVANTAGALLGSVVAGLLRRISAGRRTCGTSKTRYGSPGRG